MLVDTHFQLAIDDPAPGLAMKKIRECIEQINIEIQVNNYGNFKERALYYWSKIFTMKLNKNEIILAFLTF